MAKKIRREIHHTKWIGAILVGILIVVLIVTFTSKKANKKNNKQMIVGMTQEPNTLDPLFMEMAATYEMYWLMYEDMVEQDENWNYFPRIVTEIPTFENKGVKRLPGNKVQVTWYLKEGLKWADGAPLTAEDFIFTHQMIMDERLPVITRDADRRIEKMEAPDDRTLVVTWKEPYARYFLGHMVVPKHIVEEEYKKNPEKYHESFFNRKPIGIGAFQMTEWAPGSHMIFERNPHWAGTPPILEKIIYKFITATNALESNLLSGTIDAISPLGLSLDQALDFERRHGDKFTFHYKPALTWEHIDCNLESPILKDKRVRQALMYGANRQMISDVLFQGKQQVADSWLPPKHYGYNPKIKHYAYDPDKAKKLLEEAGWVESTDGIRVNNRGEKLRLTIMATAGNKTREQTEQILQSDWKKIGIDLEIMNQPGQVFFGETVKKRKFKHLALYAWGMDPMSDGESLWTKENIPSEKNNWQGQNNPGWIHEESDKLNHLVPVTLEEAKRKELLEQQQVIWAEEIPALPLFFRSDISVTPKNLKNWKMTGTLTPVTWNAEIWELAN
ncbi:MAG: peptide ABC transporter substrate-binding protein [Deltaproteobacteria bacterium]|nr:peptide ABC transporter substrate-binding protein [Deltaproteobacteria bacterium]